MSFNSDPQYAIGYEDGAAPHRKFAEILARAWSAELFVNPHRQDGLTVDEYLDRRLLSHEDDVPHESDAVRGACIADDALWVLYWWSSSCGHFEFYAPSYDDLVRQVLASDANLVAVGRVVSGGKT